VHWDIILQPLSASALQTLSVHSWPLLRASGVVPSLLRPAWLPVPHFCPALCLQALTAQLREDMKAAEAAAARKLDAERSVRRAADEELARTRAELESLQTAAPGGSSSWGAQGHFPGGPGGPPAMAAPGFKWVLVSEAEEAAAAGFGGAAAAGLSRRLSSMSGAQQLSGMLDEDLAVAAAGQLGGSQSHQGSEAAGLFDPGELFANPAAGVVTPSYTPRASAAGAGAAGDAAASVASQGYAGGVVSSPTASVTSSRAAGARAVAARLGGGSSTVAEAAVQRLRAALRQKAGECASMEGRLRELEATRDQLASELVKATHSAEQVGCCWGV
jgi:hypothetical protein